MGEDVAYTGHHYGAFNTEPRIASYLGIARSDDLIFVQIAVLDTRPAEQKKAFKLPPGFKAELWAHGINNARAMTWGDKGTLFVGSFSLGNVYAIDTETGDVAWTAELAGPVTNAILDFTKVNEMESCAPPGELGGDA